MFNNGRRRRAEELQISWANGRYRRRETAKLLVYQPYFTDQSIKRIPDGTWGIVRSHIGNGPLNSDDMVVS